MCHIKTTEAAVLWLGLKQSALWLTIFIRDLVSVPSCRPVPEQSAALYEWITLLREGTVVNKTSVSLCVNGESVQTGSAAWSISIILKKAMKCHRLWHLKMPGYIEQECGKMKYLNQVLMWTADTDLAASRLLITAACLKFKHDAQIPPWQLLADRYSEGYSLMAPERVPMDSSCRVGL